LQQGERIPLAANGDCSKENGFRLLQRVIAASKPDSPCNRGPLLQVVVYMRENMPVYKDRIVALRDFRRFPDGKFSFFGLHVHDSLLDNERFPRLPVSLEDLKSKLDRFEAARAEALHRDVRVIALKNSLRQELDQGLILLAAYVEFIAGADRDTFISSGFNPAPSSYTGPQPLGDPKIENIEQGNTGQLRIWFKNLGRQARTYEYRYGVADTPPDTWTTQKVGSASDAILIDGLVPGTIYAFQVRACGVLGETDWSDSATRMCI
jgi:hypothetical protein